MNWKATHRDRVAQRGFTQIENVVLFDERLSIGARVMYAALKHFAWRGDGEIPPQAEVAEALGVSERSLKTYASELREVGLVTMQRRIGKPSLYVIEPPDSHSPSGKFCPIEEADFAPPSGQNLPENKKRKEDKKTLSSNEESARSVQIAVDRAIRAEIYGDADVKLTDREARKVAVAATSIRKAGGTPDEVVARCEAYRRHKTYGGVALTAPSLAEHWSELSAPAKKRAAAKPCDECGIGGGHLADCSRAKAA